MRKLTGQHRTKSGTICADSNMLTAARQARLNPILFALRSLPGVASVQQDDYDSTAVNVFVYLRFIDDRPRKPTVPLRSIKAGIRRICRETGFQWLHVPSKRYSWSPSVPGIPRERFNEGYDCDYIKMEVLV